MRRLIILSAMALLTASAANAQRAEPLHPASMDAPAVAAIQTLKPVAGTTPKAEQDAPRAPYLGGTSAYPPASATTNIRLELTITDTFTGTPVVKAVSMVLLTGNSGMIRTTNYGKQTRSVLNVDANAAAYKDGSIAVRLTYEYTPPIPAGEDQQSPFPAPPLNESITVVLKDGESMMVSESADPATDRKVTTELKATILK